MLNEKEFFEQLAKVPGVRIEGNKVYGIRFLTPEEQKIRNNNEELIR